MVIYRPSHAQLRHPLLNVGIDDAAHARTLWAVHFASTLDLLRRVAVAQRFLCPDRIVSYPPERVAFPMAKCPYGFQFLVVRHADLAIYVPELAPYPTQIYPARPLSGGPAEQLLIVDGWANVVTGLLTWLPHVSIQLEGDLGGIQEAAWRLLDLGVALDATVLIRNIRGPLRAHYDRQGWTGIDGFRKATGLYRDGSAPKGPGICPGEEAP